MTKSPKYILKCLVASKKVWRFRHIFLAFSGCTNFNILVLKDDKKITLKMVICRCIWRKSSIILPRSAVTNFVSWSWATHILYMMTVVIVEIGRPTCLIHGAVVFLLRNKDDWSFSKSSYILRRPQNMDFIKFIYTPPICL